MAVTQITSAVAVSSQEPPMSVADQDRAVFQRYAEELGPGLSRVWRRERTRCVLRRAGRAMFAMYARAGLTMVGINPAVIQSEGKVPAGPEAEE
jgi:hypothetical protein